MRRSARASRWCTRATSRSSPKARSATGATSSSRDEFADVAVGWDDCDGDPGDKILVKDAIADITLQQVLTRPDEFDVIATTNLNGDYLSDALAAQVGGIGIAPGGNINYVTGHGIFEATHGTAPKYAGQDKVNPGSVLLSGVMMFEHLGWDDAADAIVRALEATIGEKIVTYDFARLMDGATEVKTSRVRAGDRRPAVVISAHPHRASELEGGRVLLAELNVRHTRRHMPTRRVALDDGYLPTSGPAFGGVLLGAVVAEHVPGLDEEQLDALQRLVDDARATASPCRASRCATGSRPTPTASTSPGTASPAPTCRPASCARSSSSTATARRRRR